MNPPGGPDEVREPPLIAHVIFELGVGGLENGLINLINRMPPGAYRHAIVCVKGAGGLERRLTRSDITIVALNKAPGLGLGAHKRAWRLSAGCVLTSCIPAISPRWRCRAPPGLPACR